MRIAHTSRTSLIRTQILLLRLRTLIITLIKSNTRRSQEIGCARARFVEQNNSSLNSKHKIAFGHIECSASLPHCAMLLIYSALLSATCKCGKTLQTAAQTTFFRLPAVRFFRAICSRKKYGINHKTHTRRVMRQQLSTVMKKHPASSRPGALLNEHEKIYNKY